jgi:low affinity Fe/Cu permease
MNKFLVWVSPVIGILVLVGLVFITIGRFFDWLDGDPLVPITALIIIFIGSALFQQTVNIAKDMAEVKRATIMFLQQARSESELLTEMSKYYRSQDAQKPDLN